MHKLILLTVLVFLASCKTLVIVPVKPIVKYEIAETQPYYVQCVRIGTYPKRFIRSRARFYSYRLCNKSSEIKRVRRRLNRRY